MAILLFTFSCKNNIPSSEMEITGTIQQQGITSYQYGSHTISNEETFYALTSERVNLNNYLNQKVTIVAERIEGYPVDGGPVYLKVLTVK